MRSDDNQRLRTAWTTRLQVCLCWLLIVGSGTIVSAQTVAYTNVTIESPNLSEAIANGTLVVQGDEIIDVGDEVQIPDDARVVSLKGMTIMPGVVDPYFVFKRSQGATRTVVFQGRTITIPARGGGGFTSGSFNWVGRYFVPHSFNFRPAMRSGITTGNLVADGRGLSAFSSILGEPNDEMVFKKEGFLFAQLTNQTAAIDIVRKPLEKDAKKPAASTGAAAARGRARTTATAANDPTNEYWDAVRKGDSPVFVNVNNGAGVAHLLRLVKEHEKVRLVLVATGPNLFQSLDDLKANPNVTVVLQPGIDQVPFKSDQMNVSRMLAEREIPFAISMSLSNAQLQASQDDPFFPLAMLVRNGLDRQKTLKSVTIEPAKLLGIEKSHGSLEKGKKANFLVFDGDPLETGSQLKQVILDGKLTYEN